LQTEGVSGISFPGVLPSYKNKLMDVDVYISIKYGVKIPEVAWNVQENIKNKLDSIPNNIVGRINIHVEEIKF